MFEQLGTIIQQMSISKDEKQRIRAIANTRRNNFLNKLGEFDELIQFRVHSA